MNQLKQIAVLWAAKYRKLLTLALLGLFCFLATPHTANAMAIPAGIDFSDITSLWPSISTFLQFIAAAIAAAMIIMTIVKLIGRDWGEAIMYAAGAAVCGYVSVHATTWIGAETGVAL